VNTNVPESGPQGGLTGWFSAALLRRGATANPLKSSAPSAKVVVVVLNRLNVAIGFSFLFSGGCTGMVNCFIVQCDVGGSIWAKSFRTDNLHVTPYNTEKRETLQAA
jgi:hypothetical protein